MTPITTMNRFRGMNTEGALGPGSDVDPPGRFSTNVATTAAKVLAEKESQQRRAHGVGMNSQAFGRNQE